MPETGWDRLSVFFFVWDLPPKVGNWSRIFSLVLKQTNLSKNQILNFCVVVVRVVCDVFQGL